MLAERSKSLQDALRVSGYQDRLFQWRRWFDRSFVSTLRRRLVGLRDMGLDDSAVEDAAARGAMRPHTHATYMLIRSRWQSTILQELRRRGRPQVEGRLHHKFSRWPKPIFERLAVNRMMEILARVRRLVTPRVAAAVLRTIFNGWTTDRRFQRRGHCRFGCQDAEDSIEHYAACTFIRQFSQRFLGLPNVLEAVRDRVARFVSLGAWMEVPDDTELTKRAVLVYAVYRAFLLHKHTPGCTASTARQALPQLAREAVRYHQASRQRVVQWLPVPSSTASFGQHPLDVEAEAATEDGHDAT